MIGTLIASKPSGSGVGITLHNDAGRFSGIRKDIFLALAVMRSWIRGSASVRVRAEDLEMDAPQTPGAQGASDNIAAIVELSAAKGLVQRFSAPASAKKHLNNIVENKIHQLTPFQPEDVYFGHSAKMTHGKMMSVKMVVAPKAACNHAVDAARKAGYSIDMVTVDGAGEVNILPTHLMDSPNIETPLQNLIRINIALIILICLLVFGGGAGRLAWAAVEAQNAERGATNVLEARREALSLTRKMAPLSDLRNNAPDTPLILNALANALSDDAWLDRVTIDQENLDIQGYADAASSVLSSVDALPNVKEAAFRATVTRDAKTGKERFNIRAKLERKP